MGPRWLPALLSRIHALSARGSVRITYKALRELASLGMGLDVDDACDILAHLDASDFWERRRSERTGEWMYVFKPVVAGTTLYVKLVVRESCVVVSMHEDEAFDE